jgi:opacity protein-like surface antigen
MVCMLELPAFFRLENNMKKIMSILGALIITASVNAADINDKFYAGVTVGGTVVDYKPGMNDIFKQGGISEHKLSPNLGIAIGKGFGSWGLELNAMFLNLRKNVVSGSGFINGVFVSGQVKQEFRDWMVGLDAYYNFFRGQKLTCKFIVGLAGIKSTFKQNITGNQTALAMFNYLGVPQYYSKEHGMRLAPKVGLGLQYAITNNFAITASVNYLKPISHFMIDNVGYANVGFNFYI